MKKYAILSLILLTSLAFCNQSKAQGFEPGAGFKQVNFGTGTSGWGIALWGGMDFGVADKITIGPWLGFRTDSNVNAFTFSFRGDYHYGAHIPGLPEELDLYGGLGIGYTRVNFNYVGLSEYNEGYTDVWLNAGARWYFSPQWGVMAEGTGGSRGNLAGLLVGLSYKF